jgi:hypothetical protein
MRAVLLSRERRGCDAVRGRGALGLRSPDAARTIWYYIHQMLFEIVSDVTLDPSGAGRFIRDDSQKWIAFPAGANQVTATLRRISVPYNHELASVEEVLKGVQEPGDFFMQGVAERVMPRIEVDGVGALSFPVPPAQIQRLIQQATRAPYGRGEKTIVHESVRKVWQVPPEKVRISGKSWANSWREIVARVRKGLGCGDAEVRAEFYKLLIYDTGGFFTAHRDTEKASGMFGTLIVVLPSAHRGGELIVRHAGREVTVDMAGAKTSELAFSAFYADCEHEVRPITEGDRVCLVYNLIQSRRATASRVLSAPVSNVEVQTVAERFDEAFAEEDKPVKLVWLLEHQYSPAELSFAALNNADAARARVILAAAERSDCAVHLRLCISRKPARRSPRARDLHNIHSRHHPDCLGHIL